MQKPDKDAAALRDGLADLETGVLDQSSAPEMHTLSLFTDQLIGVVRQGHPLSKGKMTPARYAQGRHIGLSMRGNEKGVTDDALAAFELERDIVVTVGGFSAALALARGSDLIATVPRRHTGMLRHGMHSFGLPFAVPHMTVSLLWHPRLDADQAHRWLRGLVVESCKLLR